MANANPRAESFPFPRAPRTKSVAVLGAGGNIGSHLVGQLARLPGVHRILLIDPDRYEEKNLASQELRRKDIGRAKVAVQAARVRGIAPEIEAIPIAARLEDVPLGRLRSDLIVAGLDSRAARQSANQAAWRLGIPWIDAGVSGAERLARIDIFAPGSDQPCLECQWSKEDYTLLEQRHLCQPDSRTASPRSFATNAPAYLGAFAASLAINEAERILNDEPLAEIAGRQILFDMRHQTHFVTSLRKHSGCRFDHSTWRVEQSPRPLRETRLSDLLIDCASVDHDNSVSDFEISCEGDRFWMRAVCPQGCAAPTSTRTFPIALVERCSSGRFKCRDCGHLLTPRGWDVSESIRLGTENAFLLKRRLSQLGLRPHDILTVRQDGAVRHWEWIH